MKIRLVGKNLNDIRPLLGRCGFVEDENCEPELVIAHGGDGALLGAARAFPHSPILPLRDARTAHLCPDHEGYPQLTNFDRAKTPLSRLPRVSGTTGGKTLFAVNDVFLHSYDRSSALRYRVRIDGIPYADEVVGDGVGLSSVHGSTAYYRSITDSIFRVGIGLAFNNATEEVSHLVLDAASVIEIEVTRGPGILIADNDPDRPIVRKGEVVTLRQAGGCAEIYALADFMCAGCRQLRHPGKTPWPAAWL